MRARARRGGAAGGCHVAEGAQVDAASRPARGVRVGDTNADVVWGGHGRVAGDVTSAGARAAGAVGV